MRKSTGYRFDRIDQKLERLDAKLDARIDKLDAGFDGMDAKFERKLQLSSTRRFTSLVTVISSAATIAAAVLAVIFSAAH